MTLDRSHAAYTQAQDWYSQLVGQPTGWTGRVINDPSAVGLSGGGVPLTAPGGGGQQDLFSQAGQLIDNSAGALPGGIAALLSALGFSVPAIGAAGLVYGGLQLAGLQMPWETGAGEGFIAPWTRPQVRDEWGQWVTAATRPDLFGQAAPGVGGGVSGAFGAGLGGVTIRKVWDNSFIDPQGVTHPASVQSVMLTNGTIYTRSALTGEIKKHRPKKHIVISSDPRMSSLRKLDKAHSKMEKLVRKYAPKKKQVMVPSGALSPVERKALKA
jgi:hypothetical protein